jgi:hypothetical protein
MGTMGDDEETSPVVLTGVQGSGRGAGQPARQQRGSCLARLGPDREGRQEAGQCRLRSMAAAATVARLTSAERTELNRLRPENRTLRRSATS